MVYSDYNNIKTILDFKTSNLGLISLNNATLLPPANDIFSYIDSKGVNILDITSTPPPLNTTLTENTLMKGIIFNNTITNLSNPVSSLDSLMATSINYILNTTKTDYKIGDFSYNIKYNSLFYKDNFEYIDQSASNSVAGDILDLDCSYYASQNIIKYLFLLDTLSEIYRIVNENKSTKSDIINIFNFFEIKCRYIIDASGTWKLYKPSSGQEYFYTIKFENTLSSPVTVINIINTSLGKGSFLSKCNTMITTFNDTLLKHFNYIKKADMIYADNFRNYYRLCRLMLNYNILYAVRYLIALNAYAIKDLDANPINNYNNCDSDIKFNYTDTLSTPESYEYYHNHIMPGCDNSTISCTYTYDNILAGEVSNTKLLSGSTTYTLSQLTPYNISNDTEGSTLSTYRIISTNTNTVSGRPYMSKPIGKVFTYTPKLSSSILLTITDSKIISITGITPEKEYFIKLHNFSTIGTTIPLTFTSQSLKYDWNNTTKIFHILSTNISQTISLEATHSLYIININSVGGQITYPSVFSGTSKMTILFSKLTTADKAKLNVSPYSINANNLVTVTYDDSLSSSSTVISVDSMSSHFYSNSDRIASLQSEKLSDETVFNLINTKPSAFQNISFSITNKSVHSSATSVPLITPVSFETTDYQLNATIPLLTDFLQYYYFPTLTNYKNYVSNVYLSDTRDGDEIIRTMTNLSSVNDKISKNSAIVKKNYNNFKNEQTKVVSSNTSDIVAIVLFVITLFVALYIPFASFNKNILLMITSGLFCIVLIIFIILYSIVYTNYTELFSIFDSANLLTYTSEINNILLQLMQNMYNERTRISEQVILPSILKENKYFQQKNDRLNIYKTSSFSDLQIEKRHKQNNVNRITFLLHITLIIATSLVIYVVLPQYWKIILAVSIILIIFALFIYYIRLVNVVHTNANNLYWSKPEASLKDLSTVNSSI